MQKNLQKFHAIFLYGFFFALPWQTIWIIREVFFAEEKWQYGTIGLYASDILLFAWICISVTLYHEKIISFVCNNNKIIVSSLLLSLWGFLSIFWADDKILATYFAIKLSFALDIFILLQIIPTSFKKICVATVVSSVLQSLIGLHQFITQSTFSNTLLGTQYHDISWGGTAIITVANERWIRIYGGMPHPNIFGGLLIIAILLSLYLYTTYVKKSLFKKIFILLCMSLFSINVIMTFSRTAWFALFFIIIFFVLFYFIKEKSIFYKNISALLIITLSIFFTAVICAPLIFTRITHDTVFTHNSFDDRNTYITHALILIKNHPILGTGIGNYTNTIYHIQNHITPIWYYQPVHNTFLLLFAELGMIGVIFFAFFFFVIFETIHTRIHSMAISDMIISLIIFSLIFIALFDHWIWSSHFGLVIFFTFLGLLVKKRAVTTDVVTA